MPALPPHSMPRNRRRLLSGALALMLASAAGWSGNAQAQWIMKDPTAISNAVQEYAETAKRWKQEYDHYQQQLIKLRQLSSYSAQFGDTFPARSLSHGLDRACPGSSALPSSPTDLVKWVVPQLQGDVVAEQRKLCARIVMAENTQYNETVQVLKTLVARKREYDRIEAQRAATGSSQGNLAANDNETQRLLARTTMDVEFWQARMNAYGVYIAALKKESDYVAQCAMRSCDNGLKQVIGNVVQAATLAAALSE